MKKFLFLSIVGAIVLAMTFSSCSKKPEPQNTEEAIAGTDYVLVTTPDGAKGVKKGEAFVISPSAEYKSIAFEGGMFLVSKEAGQVLVDTETGQEIVSGDTFLWKETFFEAKRGNDYVIYIPAYKLQFVAQAYQIKGSYVIALSAGKVTVWQEGNQLNEPGEYAKIAVLPDGKLLVFDGRQWRTATIKENKQIQPGRAVKSRDLAKYKKLNGWDETAAVMILE